MKILSIDLETDSNVPEEAKITEIGAVLWDTEFKTPASIFSKTVLPFDGMQISEEIEACTHLNNDILYLYGEDIEYVLKEFSDLYLFADYIAAHNGNVFDKTILLRHFSEYQITVPETVWIDSMLDIQYPSDCVSRNLTYLCAYHGFLNPFPHRAVFDAISVLKIMENYELDEIIRYAESPKIKVIAQVSYAERQLAKDEGFSWDASRKIWYKDMNEAYLNDKKDSFCFTFRTEML